MRRGSRGGVSSRLRTESLWLLVLIITERIRILVGVSWSRSGLSAGLVVGVVVFLPVGTIVVLRRRLVLRLGLVVGLRLVLGLGSDRGWCAGRSRKMVSGSLETVFAGSVSYGPPLAAGVDVAVGASSVAIGVALFVEFNTVFLFVSRPESSISR